MGEKLLTGRTRKGARPKSVTYYKSDAAGLHLQVRPDGARYWMLGYSLTGKESMAGLGAYPGISLEEARCKADTARKLILPGVAHPGFSAAQHVAEVPPPDARV